MKVTERYVAWLGRPHVYLASCGLVTVGVAALNVAALLTGAAAAAIRSADPDSGRSPDAKAIVVHVKSVQPEFEEGLNFVTPDGRRWETSFRLPGTTRFLLEDADYVTVGRWAKLPGGDSVSGSCSVARVALTEPVTEIDC